MGAHRDSINSALAGRGISLAGPISRYALKELIRVVEVMGGRLSFGASAPSVYDTDPDQGANAAAVYTAAVGASPVVKIAYANTGAAGSETVALTVAADGSITVTVAIATGVSTSTQVATAITAAAISAILTRAHKAGNSGAGVVVTMAAKTLAGGADAGFVIAPAA